MNFCYNSNYTQKQNQERCHSLKNYGYLSNGHVLHNDMQNWNACASNIKTQNCNPLHFQGMEPAKPKDMDPVLYNILNGCWLCNYEQQEFDNQYLCNRNFYYPEQIIPCNPYSFIPKNSADEL